MNVHVSEYPSYQKQYDAIKLVKARIWGAPAWKPPVVLALPSEKPVIRMMPLWRCQDMRFEAHVTAYREHIRNPWVTSAQSYLKRRSLELDISLQKIMSRSREHKVVHARHLLIWEIKTYVTQDITWNRLGRMFGGMDHTSIHYAFHKIAAMKSAGTI